MEEENLGSLLSNQLPLQRRETMMRTSKQPMEKFISQVSFECRALLLHQLYQMQGIHAFLNYPACLLTSSFLFRTLVSSEKFLKGGLLLQLKDSVQLH